MVAKWKSARISCLVGIVVVLSGCTSAVVIDSEFPRPLIDTRLVSVGLFFEPELRDFIHAEALPRRSTWTIDLGDANLAMLDPLFETMFASTVELDEEPAELPQSNALDGILRSSLERFEFDVPRVTRDEFAEVWLQYRLELRWPNGELVVDWPVSGYGKAEIYRDREEAVRRAAIVAMREAGARISTEFLELEPVITWLQEVENAGI
ncbi:MAG: hypothetical protein R3305_03715 [Gammaproteobacteria bacterium]|nr:hypothetical protein [Gammaproteobacteria bacterium]